MAIRAKSTHQGICQVSADLTSLALKYYNTDLILIQKSEKSL